MCLFFPRWVCVGNSNTVPPTAFGRWGLSLQKKNNTNSADAAEGTWFATFDGHHQNGGKEADLWDLFFSGAGNKHILELVMIFVFIV